MSGAPSDRPPRPVFRPSSLQALTAELQALLNDTDTAFADVDGTGADG